MQKNLQFYILTLLIFNFQFSIVNSLSAQTVTNVTAVQEGKAIKISYDLDKAADVSVFVSTNGGYAYVELHEVSGDVGENVKEGHNEIVWNVLGERENLIFDNVVFKIKAKSLAHECPTFVSDYDGNSYKTVLIGTQCWMAENLRTTHYANGEFIPMGSHILSYEEAFRYCPDNKSSNVRIYGYLYNWKAVMGNYTSSSSNPSGVQGICPTGWHVPSDAEWTQLAEYVGSKSEYQCNGEIIYIAKALAATTGWNCSPFSCAVGNNQSTNNDTGFSAVPAGDLSGSRFFSLGTSALFWSSVEYSSSNAYYYHLYYGSADVNRYYTDKDDGYSVRCLRD